jgi:hypothetical protein
MKIKTPTKAQVEMTVRCKAFSGEGVKEHRVRVDDVSVRVLDPVSGHYTLCHSLSKAAIKRIIARAESGEGR